MWYNTQDENSTVLSHVAAEDVYEAVKDNTDKKTRQSAEIYVEKCVEAHGEFILRFIFGVEIKRLRYLCTILIIALPEAVQVNGSPALAMKILKEGTLAAQEEKFHTALVLSQHVCRMDPTIPVGFATLAEAYDGLRKTRIMIASFRRLM